MGTGSGVELREVAEEDWAALREVRLRALADAPDAFGATLAEARAHPPQAWRDRAGGPGPLLLAVEAGRPVAMGGLSVPEGGTEAYVWGMWVEPAARGRGLGARLLDALLARAEGLGRDVLLHVSEGNAGARALYVARGFAPTGTWQPLREGSDLRVEELRRPAVRG